MCKHCIVDVLVGNFLMVNIFGNSVILYNNNEIMKPFGLVSSLSALLQATYFALSFVKRSPN